MAFQQLASIAQGSQRSPAGLQILLAEVSHDEASRTSLDKQNVQVFFKTGQGAAYRRCGKVEFSGSSRQCAFLADSNKSTNIVEIGYLHATSLSPIAPTVMRNAGTLAFRPF